MKAVITGASSGIGAAFAQALAADGRDLLLTGRRLDKLEAQAQHLRDTCSVRVETYTIELSDSQAVQSFAEHLRGELVGWLINNAGYGLQSRFESTPYGDWEDMMQVHALAPMQLCDAVIPGMKLQGHGRIINVSSVAAFFPMPGNVIYSGSKAFLNHLSEGLHMELAPFGIRVQALCPGFTRSDFHQRMADTHSPYARQRFMQWQQAEDVVRISLRAVDRGRVYCVPGFSNRMLTIFGQVVPRSLWHRIALRFTPEDTELSG